MELRNKLLQEVCERLIACGFRLDAYVTLASDPTALPEVEHYEPHESDQEDDENDHGDDESDEHCGLHCAERDRDKRMFQSSAADASQSLKVKRKKKSGKKKRKTDKPAPNPEGTSKQQKLNIYEARPIIANP